jgi:hypothetical protein
MPIDSCLLSWYLGCRGEGAGKDAATMSEESAEAGKGPPQVKFKKTIVPFEQEGPEEEPLFVNLCEVAFHDDVAYVDVGVVPLDEVLNRKGSTELPFLVLNRLVMGLPTLKNLKDQIVSLLDSLEKREAV